MPDTPIPIPIIAVSESVTPESASAQIEQINPIDSAEMVWIPPGEFLMGDDDQEDNPRRTVTLSGYWIYKNVVTVRMYKLFCQETGANMPPKPKPWEIGVAHLSNFNPDWSKMDHPIVNVSWNDANTYCAWAGVALPTEAQWEKAARGPYGNKYPWGNKFDARKVWASKKGLGDAGGTTTVGKYGVSPYGCIDMAGNVWQWCSDWYDADSCKNTPTEDPIGASSGTHRVVRGSSWGGVVAAEIRAVVADGFRASYRIWGLPDFRHHSYGFRCVAGE